MSTSLQQDKLPQAVLFDWDNTLVDTWPVIIKSMNRTLEHMGREPWTEEEGKARIDRSLRDSFPDFFGQRWQEAMQIYYDFFSESHLEMLSPLPSSLDVVRYLAQNGVWTAVVSNKTGRFLRAEAQHLGWDSHFQRLVGAGDAEFDKPDIAPVHMALEGAGFGPDSQVWFVGDKAIDLKCASLSGCSGILMQPDPPAAGDFSQWPPRAVFGGCCEFLSFLRTLPIPIS